jgi:hypothetical protein
MPYEKRQITHRQVDLTALVRAVNYITVAAIRHPGIEGAKAKAESPRFS